MNARRARNGIGSTRAGVRIGACAVLSAASMPQVTEILLDLLRSDHSKWVRLQALRSLAVPGRGITRDVLLQATETETEEEVLDVRRELLGV